VKHGEHLLALSTGEKNFFMGLKPSKDVHRRSPALFRVSDEPGARRFWSKIADKHRKVKQSEHYIL